MSDTRTRPDDARNHPHDEHDGGTLGEARRAHAPDRSEQAGTDGDVSERHELEPKNTGDEGSSDGRCNIDEMPPVEELELQRWTAELSPDDLEND